KPPPATPDEISPPPPTSHTARLSPPQLFHSAHANSGPATNSQSRRQMTSHHPPARCLFRDGHLNLPRRLSSRQQLSPLPSPHKSSAGSLRQCAAAQSLPPPRADALPPKARNRSPAPNLKPASEFSPPDFFPPRGTAHPESSLAPPA